MSENGMKLRSSTDDFIRIFESNLSPQTSYKAAYEAAERVHKEATGQNRYTGYESFRSVKNKRAKSKFKR